MKDRVWVVFWKERTQDKYMEIARYENRFLAEDHAKHVESRVQGHVKICCADH